MIIYFNYSHEEDGEDGRDYISRIYERDVIRDQNAHVGEIRKWKCADRHIYTVDLFHESENLIDQSDEMERLSVFGELEDAKYHAVNKLRERQERENHI